MFREKCIITIAYLTIVISISTYSFATDFVFHGQYIDLNYGGNGRPGWVRAGDLDKDGDLDIVAGGGTALYIYENNSNQNLWLRHGNLDATGKIGANGAALYDVDQDGDLDVVSALYKSVIGWWENPGGRLKEIKWKFQRLIDAKWFLHDLILTDLDRDGKRQEFVANLNSGYWQTNIKIISFQRVNKPSAYWRVFDIDPLRNEGNLHGHAGIDVGDIDKDGIVDLAYSNGWYKAPSKQFQKWIWMPVAEIYGISNTLLRDMDGDDDLDLIMSAGHHGKGIYWYQNNLLNNAAHWQRHDVDSSISNPEGLAVVDMDNDGDYDIITCDLDFKRWNKKVHNVYIFENLGHATDWKRHNIASNVYPSHQIQAVDLNKDGKSDIISEGAGYKVVSYYKNMTNPKGKHVEK